LGDTTCYGIRNVLTEASNRYLILAQLDAEMTIFDQTCTNAYDEVEVTNYLSKAYFIRNVLSNIESNAFQNCNNVKRVYAHNLRSWMNINFEDGDSNPLNSDAELYLEGELLEDLHIPFFTYKINQYAFYCCGSLKRLFLNPDTREIMPYAFAGCDLLEEIHFVKNANLVAIDGYSFIGCDMLSEVNVPATVKFVGVHAFSECSKLRSVIFDSGSKVTSLGDCFSSCPELEHFKLPDNLQYLSESFTSSKKLLQKEGGVLYVDNWAVGVSEKVKTIRLKDGTKGVGVGIPYYIAQELKKIYIPESVMYISQGAFSSCKSAIFYCEAQSKPKTWIVDWKPQECSVIWGYTEESTDSSSSTSSSNNSNSSAS